jgi:ABC-type sugar transport system ATPase subunit
MEGQPGAARLSFHTVETPTLTGSPTFLHAEALTKSYSGNRVLDSVSLDALPGQVLALVGENGAGKTTFMNIVTGVVPADEGTVTVGAENVHFGPHEQSHWGPRRAQLAGISSVRQELSLAPDLSVVENISLANWPMGVGPLVDRRAMRQRAVKALAEVGLDVDPRIPVRSLSLGQQQLVELAKALSVDPRLLFLDEATSALDEDQVAATFLAIRRFRDRGGSVVFVSHRLDEVFAISQRVAVLKDGVLVGVRDTPSTNVDELVKMMVGRSLQDMYPPKALAGSHGPDVVTVSDMTIGKTHHTVSLTVRAGEILGLGGLQGQGQREVLRGLFGISGRSPAMSFADSRHAVHSPGDAVRSRIAYLPADRKVEGLLLPLSVRFNVSLPSIPRLSELFATVRRSREVTLVRGMIDRLRIKVSSLEQPVGRLSGGNQQKVALAKWLAIEPHLYLLDDPARGIDVGTKREIYFLLRKVADEGAGVVVTSTDTMELAGMCDRILVFYEGRIVDELVGDHVNEENLVRASVTAAGRIEPEPT